MRDLKSVVARGSLAISKPVIIPIGLLLAMLWLTGKKGVRSVLLESPVARAVTRTMVQASSEGGEAGGCCFEACERAPVYKEVFRCARANGYHQGYL